MSKLEPIAFDSSLTKKHSSCKVLPFCVVDGKWMPLFCALQLSAIPGEHAHIHREQFSGNAAVLQCSAR